MVELIQWVVRGVDKDLARQFVDRAARQRRATGDVLNELLRAYLDRPEDPAQPAAGASLGSKAIADIEDLKGRIALLQTIQESQARQEQTTLKYTAMTESLSDRVKVLEQRADQQAATSSQQHTAVTRPPRQPPAKQGAAGGDKKPTEQDLQIAEMLNARRSYSEIAKAVDVDRGSLTRIKRRLKRQGLLTVDDQPEQPAEPAGHVDENPEPPVESSTE